MPRGKKPSERGRTEYSDMNSCLYSVRARFHPLNHLRRHALSRAILRTMDVPIWAKLPGVDWKCRVRLVRHVSSFILSGGAEPDIFALFCAIGQQFRIRSFWDVGANVGYYSWLTKSIAPKAEVRMFEPDPDNLALIHETVRHAWFPGITVREVAVSDTHGARRFARDEVSGSTGGIQETADTYSERQWGVAASTMTVDTVSLDDERAAAAAVDLIKIDVEGHEEAVVRGGHRTIEHDQPILIFECFHGGAEIIEFLRRLGYRIADAEGMDERLTTASNFLALPPRHRASFDKLRQCWRDRVARNGYRA